MFHGTWHWWSVLLLLLLATRLLSVYSQCGSYTRQERQENQDEQSKLALYKVSLRTYWSRARFPRHYPEWKPPAQFGKLFGKASHIFLAVLHVIRDSSCDISMDVEINTIALALSFRHAAAAGNDGSAGILLEPSTTSLTPAATKTALRTGGGGGMNGSGLTSGVGEGMAEFKYCSSSGVGMGRTHDSSYILYRLSEKLSPGAQLYVETGRVDELDTDGDPNILHSFIGAPVLRGEGTSVTRVFLDSNHTLISIMARINPSPDWFVGVDSFQLCVDGNWVDTVTVEKEKSFLWCIVTGDEKWIYFDNPKRRKSWVDPGQPSTTLMQKRPSVANNRHKVILLHDNARPHVTKSVKQLDPFDGGTDNGFTFTATNWPTQPKGIVYRITSRYPAHPAGSFYYPNLLRLPPIATLTFTKVLKVWEARVKLAKIKVFGFCNVKLNCFFFLSLLLLLRLYSPEEDLSLPLVRSLLHSSLSLDLLHEYTLTESCHENNIEVKFINKLQANSATPRGIDPNKYINKDIAKKWRKMDSQRYRYWDSTGNSQEIIDIPQNNKAIIINSIASSYALQRPRYLATSKLVTGSNKRYSETGKFGWPYYQAYKQTAKTQKAQFYNDIQRKIVNASNMSNIGYSFLNNATSLTDQREHRLRVKHHGLISKGKRIRTRIQRYVANQFGVSPSVINRIYSRFRETGSYHRRPGQGRSRETSAREDRMIRQVTQNRFVCTRRIAGNINYSRQHPISGFNDKKSFERSGIARSSTSANAPRDCKISEWGPWSACSRSCGVGETQRMRKITIKPRRSGASCPPLKETKWCGSANPCSESKPINYHW
ncbi:Spondin-2 [Ooceraea biroi]|uniref:Spondin-2 n=1 Tax=Ooceraea biroi TaxID=2015173 RepID=A0A026X2H5_OOCBI|nr:Spondin-2 [Ooceraea biroi]